jgi:hypothetical protein
MVSSGVALEVWDRVADCDREQRAGGILSVVDPGFDTARHTIGECEQRLLALHEALFGGHLEGFARCPQCGEALQLGLDTVSLRAAVAPGAEGAEVSGAFELDGFTVEYRALSGVDLRDAAACATLAKAHALLVERAVVACLQCEQPIAPSELPSTVTEHLAQRLAECDPGAESVIQLACPECTHEWSVLLDVGAFVWTAIRSRAQRLLREVHTLARAYGWREADIVALSPRRRAAYLEMVQG